MNTSDHRTIAALEIGRSYLKHALHAAPSREAEERMMKDLKYINQVIAELTGKEEDLPKRQFPCDHSQPAYGVCPKCGERP